MHDLYKSAAMIETRARAEQEKGVSYLIRNPDGLWLVEGDRKEFARLIVHSTAPDPAKPRPWASSTADRAFGQIRYIEYPKQTSDLEVYRAVEDPDGSIMLTFVPKPKA